MLSHLGKLAARAVVRSASPRGRRARLSVLIYHRVLRTPDPFDQDNLLATVFERQMRVLSETFNVLRLSEAITRLKKASLPARAACITFDDGYADNHDVALPILTRLGLPATFFIATGYLNSGRMWNDSVVEAVRSTPAPALDLVDLGLHKYELATKEQRVRRKVSREQRTPREIRRSRRTATRMFT